MELGGDVPLDATNIRQPDRVQWRNRQITAADHPVITLKPHSVNVVTIPLADRPNATR